MTFKNPTAIIAAILARSLSASKTTLAEIAGAIGSKSPNSVYQYETGKHDASLVSAKHNWCWICSSCEAVCRWRISLARSKFQALVESVRSTIRPDKS